MHQRDVNAYEEEEKERGAQAASLTFQQQNRRMVEHRPDMPWRQAEGQL